VDPRDVVVRDGRRVVVREGWSADRDALLALYEQLDRDDRVTRFFTAAFPRSAVDRWSTIGERGGFLIVAVPADDPESIVAEAGFTPLANGDAEWAITVAKDWRGGLGTLLFDGLLEEAAARGIPNLEGEILVRNAPMLRVARAHSLAVAAQFDHDVMRVLVGASGGAVQWPAPRTRPRALVEAASLLPSVAGELLRQGYDVLACPGPPAGREERCPLVRGESCALVDGADMVVYLRDDNAQDVVAEAHRRAGLS
jgi:hypothetical protein